MILGKVATKATVMEHGIKSASLSSPPSLCRFSQPLLIIPSPSLFLEIHSAFDVLALARLFVFTFPYVTAIC